MVFGHLRRRLLVWPLIGRALPMYGLMASRLSIKWVISTTRSRSNREVGQRLDFNAFGVSRRKVLQASFGTLLTIMPQEPQIAMRQDQR
jgi:hypothetical protein